MIGKGKYDDICTMAREMAQAQGTILIVLGGDQGSGFSAQVTPEMCPAVVQVLRDAANQLQADYEKISHAG